MEFRNKGLSFSREKFVSDWLEADWVINCSKTDNDENSAGVYESLTSPIDRYMKYNLGDELTMDFIDPLWCHVPIICKHGNLVSVVVPCAYNLQAW